MLLDKVVCTPLARVEFLEYLEIRQGLASTRDDHNLSNLANAFRFPPLSKICQRVGTHQKYPINGRKLLVQLGKGLYGVGMTASAELSIVHKKTRVSRGSQSNHFEPVILLG
jgi:hypothetical protein